METGDHKGQKNTYAVVVTYGRRFIFLQRVVRHLLRENVRKIIIVANAVPVDVYGLIKDMRQADVANRIVIIAKQENTGSAGGYKTGIAAAQASPECDFIWLLDDDNLPESGTLEKLRSFWNSFAEEDKNKRVALLANRVDQPIYTEALLSRDADLFLTRPNNFLGFHISDVWKVLKTIFTNQNGSKHILPQWGVLKVSPYGGMFFHKDLVGKIGLPNEEYFVYADDFDFSYRVTKTNGKIILVANAHIRDIDDSWRTHEIKNPIRRLLNGSPLKTYYYVRNRVYFEIKNLTNDRIMYNINTYTIILVLCIYSIFTRGNNYRLILKAIKHGRAGRLGKIELT